MRRRDRIRERLETGQVPLGIQCFSGSAPLLEIVGHAGFDFVMIDTEHACLDSAQVEQLVRVCDTVDLMPLVRVAENSPALIRKALEAGAHGVIVPQVRDAGDVRLALDAARYPTLGSRGMCPATRASRYSIEEWDEFVRWTNEHVLVIPILEHPDAIVNAEEICSLDGIEIVNFGAGDLGMALGFGAQGLRRKEVEEAFAHVLRMAAQSGKKVMTVPFPDFSADACRGLIERGVHILMHSVDELIFAESCRRIVTDLTPALRLTTAVGGKG